MKEKKQIIILIFMISVMTLMPSAFFVYGEPAHNNSSTHNSSFDYKVYPEHSEYRRNLKYRMKNVYTSMNSYMNDKSTLPIPGLIETYIKKKGADNASENYIPQGICRAGKYWLITAYDAGKEYNSVIYVIDKDKDILVSTLTLPNTYHLGGIAFDGENIWVTGDTSDRYKGSPFVQYITFADFRNMISEPLHEVTEEEISEFVYIKNKPSFLECDNGTLWVGTYMGRKDTCESYMNGYKITDREGKNKLNTTVYSVISGLDTSAQGADIDGHYLYVSSSFKGSAPGVRTSFVTKYDIKPIKKGDRNLNIESRELSRIEVPKMNEEIIVEKGMVYINFESAADNWVSPVIRTDRVLAVRKTLWGEKS